MVEQLWKLRHQTSLPSWWITDKLYRHCSRCPTAHPKVKQSHPCASDTPSTPTRAVFFSVIFTFMPHGGISCWLVPACVIDWLLSGSEQIGINPVTLHNITFYSTLTAVQNINTLFEISFIYRHLKKIWIHVTLNVQQGFVCEYYKLNSKYCETALPSSKSYPLSQLPILTKLILRKRKCFYFWSVRPMDPTSLHSVRRRAASWN